MEDQIYVEYQEVAQFLLNHSDHQHAKMLIADTNPSVHTNCVGV